MHLISRIRFTGDVSSWDVSSGTDFEGMFYNAYDFNSDVSMWDVSSGTNFAYMFRFADSFDQNLCSWRTKVDSEDVFNDNGMFTDSGCPFKSTSASAMCRACVPTSQPSTTPTALPSASASPSVTPLPTRNCVVFQLTLVTDNFGEETTWDLTNDDGDEITSGGPYPDSISTEPLVVSECLDDGDYTFTIYDSFGDGICCSEGSGSYELALGNTVLKSGGIFDDSETVSFSVPLSQENN